MSLLTHETIRVDDVLQVGLFAHSDGAVALTTTFSPEGTSYGSTSLQMSPETALKIAAALTKAAIAATAHRNAARETAS